MALDFQVTHRSASFLDPFKDFEPRTYTVEVRRDPLFGDTSRILIFRRRDLGPIDHSAYLAQDPPNKCPFCPERLDKYAARFIPEQVPEGYMRLGEAVCFPNAFPYEALNAVVVMTKHHYLRPGEVKPELLADGLWLAREAFLRLGKGLGYGSVNWNYMMPAGAGLVHPHFQIVGSAAPTRAQAAMRSRFRAHGRKHDGASLAKAYVAAERKGPKSATSAARDRGTSWPRSPPAACMTSSVWLPPTRACSP